MKTVPIVTDKILIDGFIETLRSEIDNLPWITNTFPAAKIGKRENGRLYPQVYMNNGTPESIDIEPDNSEMGYCFFEKERESFVYPADENTAVYDLNIVVWVNLSALITVTPYDNTEDLVKDIVDILHINICTDLKVTYDNPFSRYRIDISENQFLMYPFSAFKINFQRKIRIC